MPPYKPMKQKDYEKWIGQYGWYIKKAGSGDYKLINSESKVVKPFIKITHPGKEVPAVFVKETEKLLKIEGLL